MKRKYFLWVVMFALLLFLVPHENVMAENTEEAGVIYGNGNLTRAQWLHNLTVMFDITVEEDNMPDDYFTDVTPDHAYYKDIMMAAEFGIIDIEAGENVEPDAVTTREFAAHTLNYCLGYKLDDTTYTYGDVAEVTWQEDAQIAVNRGWFVLENGNFVPDKAVTGEEIKAMEADVQRVQASTVIDADYDNEYTFAENVIEVSEGTEVAIDEQENVTIVDCPVTIVQGNTFAVYVDGTAQVYTAKEVTVSGADTVIVTQEADFSEAVENVDAQGTEEGDLSEAEAIGDTEIIYIEGGTEAQAYEDGKMYKSARIAGTKNIDAIKASKTIKLSSGASFTITCTLSEVSVDYKVSIADGEAYVKANGDATFTGTVSTGSMGNGSIDLVNIPVAYVGVIKVSVDYSVSGEVTLSYTTGFRTGIQYSNSGGFRLVKNFQKKSFTIQSRAELSAGVTASVGLTKLPVVSGNLYAKMGAKTQMLSKTFNDGKTPNTCMTVSSWMYASVGANAGLDFGFTKKTFSQSYDIYNLQNSPVRVVYHFEDGKLTYPCTRNWEYANGYFTRWNSRYGSAWGGYGLDDSGTLVPVFTYTTDDDGNATITGYTGCASALVIPSEIDGHTVVAIGNRAFENRGELYSVVIPDTVTRIGDYAFAGTSLQFLDLSDELTYIGRCILDGNIGVTEIEIPKSLEEVGYTWAQPGDREGPFNGSNIQKASIEEGATSVLAHLFYENSALKEINLPESITTIEGSAFEKCTGVTEIMIPPNVISFGEYAFAGCTNLIKLEIPDSVKRIEDAAFANTNLDSLKLPNSLTYIGRCILDGNTGVTEIEIPKSLEEVGYTWEQPGDREGPFNGSNIQKASIEEGATSVLAHLFYENRALEEISLPESITTIEGAAFQKCSGIIKITIPRDVVKLGENAFADCTNLRKLEIPDSVKRIEDAAFANTGLDSLELPNSLTYIGRCILDKNTGVTEIEIPKSLEEVGYTWEQPGDREGPFNGSNIQKATLEEGTTTVLARLFYENSALEEVDLPESITTIEAAAFQKCSGLTKIIIPQNVLEIGEYAFAECSILTEIKIPAATNNLGKYCFSNCASLNKINIPKNVIKITPYIFSGCSALEEIVLPDTVTIIQNRAFKDCTNLKKITLSNQLVEIDDYAFENCKVLADVELPVTISILREGAFANCDGLTNIILPNAVTTFETKVFYDCDALTDVTLGTGITSIPSSAFEHCDVLQSIVLPYRTATVGANAFKNCVALMEITIPRATTSIDATAFSYPSKMTVYGVAGSYAETFANEQGMKFVNKEVNAEEVTLSQSELKLNKGDKGKLVMTVTPADFTDEVTWKSSDPDVVTVDDSGQISAKSVGEATVKVQVGNVSASCSVTVVQPVTSISLDKKTLEMDALDTYQLTARVSPSDAADKSVRWSSSDEKIASVDENGLVTALKKGNATITVKAQDGSGVSSTCSVTVKNTAHVAADVSEMESTHPYANNCSDFWVYTLNGADGLSVTFDAQTEMEDKFDYLYIFNATGEEIGQYTGTKLAGQTIHVPGNTVKLQLVSDDAGTAWGFKVSSITADGTQKLPQVISGTASYEKTYGDENFILDAQLTQGDGSLSYRSEDENVVTVSGDGKVTIVGIGKTNIVVTASETAAYNKAEKYISISIICKHTDESKREIRNTKEAKCTENGYTGDVYCTVCGEKVEDGTVIPATGHRWDDGEVTKEATADSDGVMTYTCQNCGAERTERIPATGKPTDDTGQGNNPGQGGNTGPSDSGNQVNGGTNGSSSGNTAGGSSQTSDSKQQASSGAAPAGAVIENPSTGDTYKVISQGRTVEYRGSANSNKKTVNVPDTVVVDGVRYQVTSIANNAFKNNKKLTSVVIGRNVTKIGKKAFFGCQKLKKVTIKTTKLKTKTVGAKAFTKAGSKNYSKLTVKVPKKCKKTYPKILKKRGLSGKAKIR
ncbi:leucine-rich repeat protein [Eubacterium sp. An3]|uniref:leucine-rich repeat protein n=1 Tax=Eubacterium sp. An3 TaxID=1965628 RepID=UPI000B3AF921|nr:leucine-rich repeat protein [Eubacterium sp. An3]OUO28827.1 hypothetical protein B5F87_06190 [Eubacterium sp. An3]